VKAVKNLLQIIIILIPRVLQYLQRKKVDDMERRIEQINEDPVTAANAKLLRDKQSNKTPVQRKAASTFVRDNRKG
jgi:predicted translin family RNA/ssDNA-binding protein